MRGRVFLTAEYHRDTGAATPMFSYPGAQWEASVEASQHWTYRGKIDACRFDYGTRLFPVESAIRVSDAVIGGPQSDIGGTWGEEPCSDVVIPWHSVRLIEVDS